MTEKLSIALASPCAFKQGWQWVRRGFSIWKRGLWLMVLVLICYKAIFFWLAKLPGAGFLWFFLSPALLLGMMNIFRALDEERPASFGMLVPAATDNWAGLLRYGGLLLLLLPFSMAIALWLMLLVVLPPDISVDQGIEMMQYGAITPEQLLTPVNVIVFILLLGCGLILLISFMLAPMLISWLRLGVFSALGESFRRVLSHWRALSTAVVILLLCHGLLWATTLIDSDMMQSNGIRILIVIVQGFVGLPIVLATLYAVARDIFNINHAS